MRKLALALLVVSLGCGRIGTVLRGSTSLFHGTAEAPASATVDHARLAALWVGHATVLLEIDGRVVATDPVVTKTVGTLAKRLVAPGLPAERWPHVDLAVISHLHFDHLSYGSLDALESKIGFLALPNGGLSYLPNYDFDAAEVEPWDAIERGGVRVTAVPARHGSGRWWLDAPLRSTTTAWVIERGGVSVFFAGDTAFDEARFAAIAARFPHLDLALLPIAPVEPRSEIAAWHMGPEEAVKAFRILGAETMIPIHFDTFQNSLDEPGDAARALASAVAKAHDEGWLGGERRVELLRIGERVVLQP